MILLQCREAITYIDPCIETSPVVSLHHLSSINLWQALVESDILFGVDPITNQNDKRSSKDFFILLELSSIEKRPAGRTCFLFVTLRLKIRFKLWSFINDDEQEIDVGGYLVSPNSTVVRSLGAWKPLVHQTADTNVLQERGARHHHLRCCHHQDVHQESHSSASRRGGDRCPTRWTPARFLRVTLITSAMLLAWQKVLEGVQKKVIFWIAGHGTDYGCLLESPL